MIVVTFCTERETHIAQNEASLDEKKIACICIRFQVLQIQLRLDSVPHPTLGAYSGPPDPTDVTGRRKGEECRDGRGEWSEG